MSNASLKEQLQAMASQISETKSHSATINRPVEKKATKPKPRSNEKSTSTKPKWLEYAQYGIELLRVYFPNCFKSMSEIRPLKIGIKHDLLKQLSTIDTIVTEDKACMVKSLAFYVNTVAYHKCVVDGATRIDLEGNPAGVVSTEEARYSSERHQARLQAKQSSAPRLQPQIKEIET